MSHPHASSELRALDLFEDLQRRGARALGAGGGAGATWSRATLLAEQGEPPEFVHLVFEGVLEALTIDPEGRRGAGGRAPRADVGGRDRGADGRRCRRAHAGASTHGTLGVVPTARFAELALAQPCVPQR